MGPRAAKRILKEKDKVGDSYIKISKLTTSRALWLRPVILATQEAEIRRIMVQSQPKAVS
jgi:hypothetical protein